MTRKRGSLCKCGKPRKEVRRKSGPGYSVFLTCGDPVCVMPGKRQWGVLEREWAALMWARGLPCDLIGKMLRRHETSVQMRLQRDGAYIDRPRFRPPWQDSMGYWWVYAPDHPNAQEDGWLRKHRLVASRMLGRPLLPGEVVHHLNGDKTDNRPENLEVLSSNSEHFQKHHAEHRWTPDMDDRLIELRTARTSSWRIAEALGVSKHSVENRMRRLRRQYGVAVPYIGRGGKRETT